MDKIEQARHSMLPPAIADNKMKISCENFVKQKQEPSSVDIHVCPRSLVPKDGLRHVEDRKEHVS